MAVARIDDRYDVLSRLGTGGMGDVWLADDLLLGRKVAIKFVSERELKQNPKAHAVLLDEARNAGQLLGHPHVVAVLDLIDVDFVLNKGPAVVLEYVDGCNVAEWIEVHRSEFDDYTRDQTGLLIATAMIEAVDAAHKLNILHRDVKPLNTLIATSGRVKVADFGLSRVVDEITRSHTVWAKHTPLYAAPEQWADEKPDESTDTYQLCATIYHLLAGVPAAQGGTLLALMNWHQHGTPEPISRHLPDISDELAKVIDAGLSNDREARPSLWKLFDAVAQESEQAPVKMNFPRSDELPESVVAQLRRLTDFGEESVRGRQEEEEQYVFVHPREAIQEAIGAKLLGVTLRLNRIV